MPHKVVLTKACLPYIKWNSKSIPPMSPPPRRTLSLDGKTRWNLLPQARFLRLLAHWMLLDTIWPNFPSNPTGWRCRVYLPMRWGMGRNKLRRSESFYLLDSVVDYPRNTREYTVTGILWLIYKSANLLHYEQKTFPRGESYVSYARVWPCTRCLLAIDAGWSITKSRSSKYSCGPDLSFGMLCAHFLQHSGKSDYGPYEERVERVCRFATSFNLAFEVEPRT